ncbi:MAG: multifunctional CCA addition/repair protein [Magnetococcales bacterium]|nr:multifunctional CCA addition/repair protein [Magnetococcales bacterium]
MCCYRVGGCVRDALLGLPIRERDWVVLGETPRSMTERGFRQVGASFPVFLHPGTREEYALARTERKSGRGYKGFAVDFSPEITLEEDLYRRDLTINAMAMDADGRVIDPWGGRRDLEGRVLRHVSEAFAEDPLRVLRVARFMARFSGLGFVVDPETLGGMAVLVASGELMELAVERVWQETVKALESDAPAVYFRVLDACGALAVLFPELAALKGKTHSPQYHPEGDAFEHVLWVLERAACLTPDPVIRFAALTHDLGKGLTPEAMLPRHHGHDRLGVAVVEGLCDRLRVSRVFEGLASRVAGQHMRAHRVLEMRPGKVVGLLETLDAWRRPEQLEAFLIACAADSRNGGVLGEYPAGAVLREALRACQSVEVARLMEAGIRGSALGRALHQERVRRVRMVLKEYRGGPGAIIAPGGGLEATPPGF